MADFMAENDLTCSLDGSFHLNVHFDPLSNVKLTQAKNP